MEKSSSQGTRSIKKTKIIVTKSKALVVKRSVGIKRQSGGLPTFQYRLANAGPTENRHPPIHPHDDNDELSQLLDSPNHSQDHEQDQDDLPSDTMMAIHSLLQQAQGLHIPTCQNNHTFVQVVVENQIFERFQEDHASTVWSELRALTRSNQLHKLSCRGIHATQKTSTSTVYIVTQDYVKGVWDAQHYHPQALPHYEPIISWFVSSIKHWTGSLLSKTDMEQQWEQDLLSLPIDKSKDTKVSQRLSLDEAIQYLFKLQVLLRDTSTNTASSCDEFFVLWLPHWGTVLKIWNEARQQLLALVARSGELSERNLLNKNRNSNISTKFLLDQLKHEGLVRFVQRPFGRFVQRVHRKPP